MTWTLSRYIAGRFVLTAVLTFLAVFVLVVLIDTVELARTSRQGTIGFLTLLGMAVLKAPATTIEAAPFTILLAAMTSFARLARSSELVVTRAAGVSVWGVTLPVVLTGAALGVLTFAVYNPLSSAFASRFETLEARYLDNMRSRLAVSDGGLWLRQGGRDGQTVFHAPRASATGERLWDVSVFRFDKNDDLAVRLEARTARLGDGEWQLNVVRRWDIARLSKDEARPEEARPERIEALSIETDLTTERIAESFSPPETIAFWNLPGFIDELDEAGFSSTRHRLHLHGLLSIPVTFAAMVLIAAAFSMRHARFGGLGLMALGCVMMGFGYFFLSDLFSALGGSGTLPPELGAWGPPVSAILAALGLILHFEDG